MTTPKDYVEYMLNPQLKELSLMANLDELKEVHKPIKALWRKYHPIEDIQVIGDVNQDKKGKPLHGLLPFEGKVIQMNKDIVQDETEGELPPEAVKGLISALEDVKKGNYTEVNNYSNQDNSAPSDDDLCANWRCSCNKVNKIEHKICVNCLKDKNGKEYCGNQFEDYSVGVVYCCGQHPCPECKVPDGLTHFNFDKMREDVRRYKKGSLPDKNKICIKCLGRGCYQDPNPNADGEIIECLNCKLDVCECGHDKKFHHLGIGGCFHTKECCKFINMDDVDCSCKKYKCHSPDKRELTKFKHIETIKVPVSITLKRKDGSEVTFKAKRFIAKPDFHAPKDFLFYNESEKFNQGYKKALDDNNILYGGDADKFMEKMKNEEERPITSEDRKLAKEIEEVRKCLEPDLSETFEEKEQRLSKELDESINEIGREL